MSEVLENEINDLTDDEYFNLVKWLSALDTVKKVKWWDYFEFDCEIEPELPKDDEIATCLGYMATVGVDLRYLFERKDVWYSYLESITEESARVAISFIEENGTQADLLVYYRAMYRFGSSVIDDKDYDALESMYLDVYPNLAYLNNRTADDDDYNGVVQEALKMTLKANKGNKVSKMQLESAVGSKDYEELNADKSKSIKPVESWEEAFEFINARDCDIMLSLKIDGINTKVFADEEGNGLKLALSRGRAADSFDYTEALKLQFECNNVDMSQVRGKLVGESFCSLDGVDLFKSKYPDKNYKTPKSTGAAMLRAPAQFDKNDFKYLKTLFFNYNDLRADKAFKQLESAGLNVPYYRIIERKDIPKIKEEFKTWLLDNILVEFDNKSKELNLSTDGVVVDLLDNIDTERADKYSDANIAIKFGPWSSEVYESTVVGIEVTQRKVEASVVLIIEPVVTRDFNTATRVGGISTAMLIEHNVRVGSRIQFTRKSSAYNAYLKVI